MSTRATITIRPRRSTETVDADACILLCQDDAAAYAVMRGRRGDLQRLLAWGSRNWFLLPPDPPYFEAIERIIDPLVAPGDAAPVELVSASCAGRAVDLSMRGGDLDASLAWEHRSLSLRGMDDGLFFALTGDRFVNAYAGSGLQRGFLVEAGLQWLFGAEAVDRFLDLKYSDLPDAVGPLYRQARERMRRHPRDIPRIDPATWRALGRGAVRN